MKLKQYLNESLESKIQKITDNICKQYKVTSVPKTKYGLTEKDWYYGDDVKI